MEKVSFESGVELRWMVVMKNRWEKDEMTVTGTHHQQVGEVLVRSSFQRTQTDICSVNGQTAVMICGCDGKVMAAYTPGSWMSPIGWLHIDTSSGSKHSYSHITFLCSFLFFLAQLSPIKSCLSLCVYVC